MPLTRSAALGNKNGVNGNEVKTETKKTKAKPSKRAAAVAENEIDAPPKKANKKVTDASTNDSVSSKKNKKVAGKKQPVIAEKEDNDEDEQEPETEADLADNEDDESWKTAETIYEFTAKDIKGNEVSLDKYKGHVCVIVNVASRCGHTKSNYEQFVEIFDKYSDEKGLRILAFPCNQFGKQESGDNAKICEFADKRNVKFDMFEKIEVNGKDAHPLWKFLTSKISGPDGEKIKWNFTKFIIDKEGKVVERHASAMKPLKLVENLEKYW